MQAHENVHTLKRTAVSATIHCLVGGSIGEMSGMVLGSLLGLSPWTTIAPAVALAFLSGYLMRFDSRPASVDTGHAPWPRGRYAIDPDYGNIRQCGHAADTRRNVFTTC